MKMFRQGDVLIVECAPEEVNGVAKKRQDGDRVILAYGEVTGHAHAFTPRNVCAFYKEGEEETVGGVPAFITVADKPAPLTHEEHDTIEVPPGSYRIIHQREYDMMEGVRRVAD